MVRLEAGSRGSRGSPGLPGSSDPPAHSRGSTHPPTPTVFAPLDPSGVAGTEAAEARVAAATDAAGVVVATATATGLAECVSSRALRVSVQEALQRERRQLRAALELQQALTAEQEERIRMLEASAAAVRDDKVRGVGPTHVSSSSSSSSSSKSSSSSSSSSKSAGHAAAERAMATAAAEEATLPAALPSAVTANEESPHAAAVDAVVAAVEDGKAGLAASGAAPTTAPIG